MWNLKKYEDEFGLRCLVENLIMTIQLRIKEDDKIQKKRRLKATVKKISDID